MSEIRPHVAQPPSAVDTAPEADWQLRKQRAHRALDTIRLCYEGLTAWAPTDVDEAERAICRRVIEIHRAMQRDRPDRARRAAVRTAAVALTILLDLIPEDDQSDPSNLPEHPPTAGAIVPRR